ncbi:MAG: 4Fe-4S cluster-binding domain-containing protein [Butyrivibrio sp.]|nr:4Fe-4S cluster-binding domain-containing protein [Butyrivibrio sp.]
MTGFDCNYSCEYCYQNQKKGDECNHLTSNDIDRVVDFYEWLGEKNNKKYIITAIDIVGGEPLLPNNFEIIKYLFDKFNNAQITITTNGTYLMKYFDLLNENKDRVFLKVSIDGEKTQHYKRRKPANEAFYDMTIQAIRNMVNVGINIAVSCVFDATYLEYQSFLNELEELGWPKRKNISLNLLPKLRCGSDGMDIAEVVENISSLKTLYQKDERVKCANYEKIIPGMNRFKRAIALAQEGKYIPYRCDAMYKPSYAFFPDGTIHFCIASMGEKGVVGRYRPNYEIYEDVVHLLKERRIDQTPKCMQCKYRVFCNGECAATSIDITGDVCGHNCGLWQDDTILNCMDGIYG